jgi:hypothetical protein
MLARANFFNFFSPVEIWPKVGRSVMGEVKLLVKIFLSCEKFEKFDYQTFWSKFTVGQPGKFDFQTFRPTFQKFAQKVKSLKIKLFCQKSLKMMTLATGVWTATVCQK